MDAARRPATPARGLWGLALLLVLLSLLYRAPALVNAGTVDSDAAIVGLQARHILAGEWSWFLDGSGYQTSVDSCVAALFFLLLGPSSLALLLSTLLGHSLATCLAFGTLARHLSRGAAFVAVLPLVFTTTPLHTYILNPPRQAALTLTFVALFVIDGAGDREETPRRWHTALGAGVASLACFADPYALLVWPVLVLLSLFTALDDTPIRAGARTLLPRVAATLAGALVGLIPLGLLLMSPRSVHGETTLTLARIPHNLGLLEDPCLPWLLGVTAYAPKALLGYLPWNAGADAAWVQPLQQVGAAVFVFSLATGALAFPFRRFDWPVRRLGVFGFVVAALTVGSFLMSVMVMDLFSSRYLAAIVLFAPFAFAPVVSALGARRSLVLLAPYLVSAALSGWVGYGAEVAGAHVVELPGGGAGDEQRLLTLLEARGIHAAIADYWVSYRLTFLSREEVVVVPIHAREDRYPAYRDAYMRAGKTAYIFDPQRSREDLLSMEKEAFEGPMAWGKPTERLYMGSLYAVVFDKKPATR